MELVSALRILPSVFVSIILLTLGLVVHRATRGSGDAVRPFVVFLLLVAANYAFVATSDLLTPLQYPSNLPRPGIAELLLGLSYAMGALDPLALLWFAGTFPTRAAWWTMPTKVALCVTSLVLSAAALADTRAFEDAGAWGRLASNVFTDAAYAWALLVFAARAFWKGHGDEGQSFPRAFLLGWAVVAAARFGMTLAPTPSTVGSFAWQQLVEDASWTSAALAVIGFTALVGRWRAGQGRDREIVVFAVHASLTTAALFLVLHSTTFMSFLANGSTDGPRGPLGQGMAALLYSGRYASRWVVFAIVTGPVFLRNQVFALDEANRRVVVGVVVIAFLGVLFLAGVLVVEDSVWSKDALSAPSIVVAGFIVLAGSQCVSLARAAANRAFPSQRQRDEAYRQSRRTQDEHATGPTVGLAPGAVLRGRYVVQSHLGQGGQGVVLVAFDSRDNQTVAVKVVPALRARGADREVAAGHRLDHANVVPLLDWYAEGEQVFLVTPFMANGSLKDQLTRKGRLDAKSARRIVLDVLHGLAAAHAAGVIHGDVKPANVLLDADGTARLVDFGAAYVLTNNSRTIDQPKGGSIPGTLCYLPPEAFADQPPTAAWDTYAVGTLLFELLQGAPPHPQEEAGPHVPFATIINTARRNDSTARFASAQEMARSLAAATYPEEIE